MPVYRIHKLNKLLMVFVVTSVFGCSSNAYSLDNSTKEKMAEMSLVSLMRSELKIIETNVESGRNKIIGLYNLMEAIHSRLMQLNHGMERANRLLIEANLAYKNSKSAIQSYIPKKFRVKMFREAQEVQMSQIKEGIRVLKQGLIEISFFVEETNSWDSFDNERFNKAKYKWILLFLTNTEEQISGHVQLLKDSNYQRHPEYFLQKLFLISCQRMRRRIIFNSLPIISEKDAAVYSKQIEKFNAASSAYQAEGRASILRNSKKSRSMLAEARRRNLAPGIKMMTLVVEVINYYETAFLQERKIRQLQDKISKNIVKRRNMDPERTQTLWRDELKLEILIQNRDEIEKKRAILSSRMQIATQEMMQYMRK